MKLSSVLPRLLHRAATTRCPGGEVVAFEPLPGNLRHLHRHIDLNGLAVRVVEAALGEEDGVMHFDTGDSSATGRLVADAEATQDSTIEVSVRSTASLIAEGMQEPHVVKMDIEGAEVTVLPALLVALSSNPIIFLAIHHNEAREACARALAERGYQRTPLDGRALDPSDEWLCTPAAQPDGTP